MDETKEKLDERCSQGYKEYIAGYMIWCRESNVQGTGKRQLSPMDIHGRVMEQRVKPSLPRNIDASSTPPPVLSPHRSTQNNKHALYM